MRMRTLAMFSTLAVGALALLFPGAARCAAQAAEHVVRPGDNLHLIAGYCYRDPRQWKKVWNLNRKELPNPHRLVPGRVLRIELTSGLSWEIPYEEFRSRVRGQ